MDGCGSSRSPYHWRCAAPGIRESCYSFALIAQDTLTVTDSVSSPCATGADATMPADISAIGRWRRIAFFGNAERRAERDAGGPGIDFGLAAGVGDGLFAGLVEQFRGLRHHEIDAADLVGAGAHQGVDHAGDLGDVAHPDRHAIAGAVADHGGGAARPVRRILRLQRQPRGLDVLLRRYRRPSAPAAPCPSPRCWPRTPRARSWHRN